MRRDLDRLQAEGKLSRVRGGVQPSGGRQNPNGAHLQGMPFHENINRNRAQKEASAGHVLCELSRVNTLVTDSGIDEASVKMIERQGVKLIVADV